MRRCREEGRHLRGFPPRGEWEGCGSNKKTEFISPPRPTKRRETCRSAAEGGALQAQNAWPKAQRHWRIATHQLLAVQNGEVSTLSLSQLAWDQLGCEKTESEPQRTSQLAHSWHPESCMRDVWWCGVTFAANRRPASLKQSHWRRLQLLNAHSMRVRMMCFVHFCAKYQKKKLCIFHNVCFIMLFLVSLLPFYLSRYLNLLIVLLNEVVSVAKEWSLLFVIQCFFEQFLLHE